MYFQIDPLYLRIYAALKNIKQNVTSFVIAFPFAV